MDWPQARFHSPVLSPFSHESIGVPIFAEAGTFGTTQSLAWPAANLALFFPFVLAAPFNNQLLWWSNGLTVAGNVDVGVYSEGGTKLFSTGSTAQAGASVIQSVAAAYQLSPGRYYMALAASLATATFVSAGSPSVLEARTMGVAQQATAFPLPAAFTLAAMATAARTPVFGLCSQSVI